MSPPPPLKGLIQVYTGDGKGKTTAALGQALRAAGRGLRTRVFQFMKPPDSTGEHLSFTNLGPGCEITPLGRAKWISKSGFDDDDQRLAAEGLNLAREAMLSGSVDLLILDEINVALHFGLLELEPVLDLLKTRPENVELILTGRNAPPEIIEAADLVTEMRLLKHPFQAGITAREGIEY